MKQRRTLTDLGWASLCWLAAAAPQECPRQKTNFEERKDTSLRDTTGASYSLLRSCGPLSLGFSSASVPIEKPSEGLSCGIGGGEQERTDSASIWASSDEANFSPMKQKAS